MLTSRSTKILKFLLSQDKKIFLKDIAEYFKQFVMSWIK